MSARKPLKHLFKLAAATALAAPLMVAAAQDIDDNMTGADSHAVMDHSVQHAVLPAGNIIPTQHMLTMPAREIGNNPGKQQMLKAGILPSGSGFSAGPLTFGMPIALLGLASLPWFWRKMKTTPPKPRREKFPATHFLDRIKKDNVAVQQMPLWHKLMRMSMLTMAITAASLPQFNPDDPLDGEGPVMLVVDNGWASAKNWQDTVKQAGILIDRADKSGRPVIILPTAPAKDGSLVALTGPMSAEEAREKIRDMKPHSWPVDRQAARGVLDALDIGENASIIWLSNGLDAGAAGALAEKLMNYGHLTILKHDGKNMPRLLRPPEISGDKMTFTVQRALAEEKDVMAVTASDESGYVVKKIDNVTFEKGQTEVEVEIDLPTDIKNSLARLSIEGESSAGAVVLLDERWRRRPVGLIKTSEATDRVSPLLDESVYIGQAFSKTDFRHDKLSGLMERPLSVMVMTDDTVLSKDERRQVDEWVKKGGTLLRFAGPHLAANPDDSLLPAPLRPHVRHMGGKLSGSKAASLGSFKAGTPFEGIHVPDNIVVEREVLAQPGADIMKKTWAQLDDGTPFVTADKRGEGWVVLVHSPARAGWSNLPLSGLFVDMMDAIVKHSQGVSGRPDGPDVSLPPYQALNGMGQLTRPPESARALSGEDVKTGHISAQTPPGYYGTQNARYAHNLAAGVKALKPMQSMPDGVAYSGYKQEDKSTDFMLPLALAGIFLLAVDSGLRLRQQGRLPFTRRRQKPENSKPEQTAKPV